MEKSTPASISWILAVWGRVDIPVIFQNNLVGDGGLYNSLSGFECRYL